jgi:hypothetical protein
VVEQLQRCVLLFIVRFLRALIFFVLPNIPFSTFLDSPLPSLLFLLGVSAFSPSFPPHSLLPSSFLPALASFPPSRFYPFPAPSGWGATLVDSLDMLLLLNMTHEYSLARQHVADIDFTYLVPSGAKTFSTVLPALEKMEIPKPGTTAVMTADEEGRRFVDPRLRVAFNQHSPRYFFFLFLLPLLLLD